MNVRVSDMRFRRENDARHVCRGAPGELRGGEARRDPLACFARVVGVFVCGLAFFATFVSSARADVAIEWPDCAPHWWDRDAVQRALAVELQATGASARPGELVLVVGSPCEDATEVGLRWRDEGGSARGEVRLADVPDAARPRAIALAVAGLVSGPREVETESETESEAESVTESETESETESNAATETATESESATETEGESAADTSTETATDIDGNAATAPEADRWLLGASALGAWTTSGTPWIGPTLGATWRRRAWSVELGAQGLFAREDTPLGDLLGRWLGFHARLGLDARFGALRLGGRLALGVDAIELRGRTSRFDVVATRRAQWTPSVELVARFGREGVVEPFVELGARSPLVGLEARAEGDALAARSIAGVLRLGLDVRLR